MESPPSLLDDHLRTVRVSAQHHLVKAPAPVYPLGPRVRELSRRDLLPTVLEQPVAGAVEPLANRDERVEQAVLAVARAGQAEHRRWGDGPARQGGCL